MTAFETAYKARPVVVVGTYTPRSGDIPAVVLVKDRDGYEFPVSINDVEVTA